MESLILSGITVESLLTKIEQLVESKLGTHHFKPQKENTDYITRKEAAALLKITLPTIHFWSKQGWLTSYKLGNRVLYKRVEVEEAIAKVQMYKHKKGGFKS